jgi:hypothetical protein
MLLTNTDGTLSIRAETYTLTFASDRPFAFLDGPDGTRIAELFILSSIHPLHDRDDTTRTGPLEVAETPDEVVFTLRAESSCWRAKTYRFRCRPRRFTYEVEVEGQGHLAEANYFGGYSSALPRWGSGFFMSGGHFLRGFTPEPNSEEQHYFAPESSMTIDMTGVPLPGRGDWFFTPAPFCFAFQAASGWLALGAEAEPGAHRFAEYRYQGGRGFHLALDYAGHTQVSGAYHLPAIGFDFAEDEFAALQKHVRSARMLFQPPSHRDAKAEQEETSRSENLVSSRLGGEQQKPDWWYEPIFCGWGAQCHIAKQEGGRAPEHARQERYEAFLKTLEDNGLSPGIVVLDDKWQATYGENAVDTDKWPDLRGFVDRQHAAGRKVLLWLKAWDPEGLPDAECITNAAGVRLAFDPSSPAFASRLRAAVRRMLGPGGYDADGFKIDFTARIPSGPGIRTSGDTWGLELMKLYLKILHDEAKQVKPDALIMTHTPHPYLSDVVDMIRLNDTMELERLPEGKIGRDITAVMRLRAKIASIACPEALIDCDNWPLPSRAAWRDYVRAQPELGVPSLYFASHVDLTGEPLDAEDYALIKEAWTCSRSSRRARQ